MSRTSKSRGASPFAMKSGNKTTFKMMGNTSPMRATGTPETYAAAIDKVTADMTDADLSNIASEQHKTGPKGKQRRFDIHWNTLAKKRKQLRDKLNENTNEEQPKVIAKPKTSGSDEAQAYAISNEDQEAIFEKFGGGVLTGAELEARNQALRDAAARY